MDKRIYVDGVVKLHSQLNNAFTNAIRLADKLVETSLSSEDSRSDFSIFVDFREEQPSDKIRGYFMFNNTILRFLPIEFEKALLFPVHNHGGSDSGQGYGISLKELDDAKLNRSTVMIQFTPIREVKDYTLFNSKMLSTLSLSSSEAPSTIDDIGKPFYEFPDIKQLAILDIPSVITMSNYTLVEKLYYAPFSKDSLINCVLFAQLNNEYDRHVIKVLRWLPTNKGTKKTQLSKERSYVGDIFFELGYMSRDESSELHSYMVENDSRLLFGTIENDVIKINGGIKTFQSNDFNYPRCLYNIKFK